MNIGKNLLRLVLPLVVACALNAEGPSADLTPVGPLDPTRTHVYDEKQLALELGKLPGWTVKEGMLGKIYTFASFPDAITFVVRISYPLQAMDHHPEIRNVYNKVFVGFTTHDQGNKVTNLDTQAAAIVEALAVPLVPKT